MSHSRLANSKLTPKEELFVVEYLKDFNAKQSAIRSGYAIKWAKKTGCHVLARPEVQERISEKFNEMTKKVEVNVEFVLRELLQIANCDVQDAYDEDQCLKKLSDMPIGVRKSISSIKVDELWEYQGSGRNRERVQIGVTKEVRFWDKKGSLELLGKYLAMFIERQRVEDANGQPLPAVEVHVHKHITHNKPVEEAITRPQVAEAMASNET